MNKIKLTSIDKIIIFLVVVLAIASLPVAMKAGVNAKAETLVVFRDGKKIGSYNLNENITTKIAGYGGGFCKLKISKRSAVIIKSTCLNKICIKKGIIMEAGQAIICAPMRLMFRVEGFQKDDLDAVNE